MWLGMANHIKYPYSKALLILGFNLTENISSYECRIPDTYLSEWWESNPRPFYHKDVIQ